MQLTRQSDYAIRTVLELAARPTNELVPVREIGDTQGVPLPFLKKLVQTLAKSGIIVAVRGSQGGIKLERDAGQITIRDVVEAVEGPFAINKCLIKPGACSRDRFCPVHRVWREAQAAMLEKLENVTFKDLIS